jgi:hypothetical protein
MRNRLFALVWVSIASALGVTACSSNDDNAAAAAAAGPNGGPGPEQRVIRINELRTQLRPIVEADCQWEFRCCNADERAALLGPTKDVTECVDRSIASAVHSEYYYPSLSAGPTSSAVLSELNRLGYGYDLGRVNVDPASVQACVSKLAARACNPPPPKDHCVPGEAPPADDPCAIERLLVGKQKVGEPCAPQSTDCVPDLHCATLRGNDGVCVERAKLGETCVRDNECGTKLVCDSRTGRCVAGGDIGAACSFTNPDRPNWDLTADRCRAGLECDTIKLKCGAPTCAGGGPCRNDAECPAGTMCAANRCAAPVKDGEGCTTDANCVNGRCRYDSATYRSVCAPALVDGSLCQGFDKDCASHFCDYDSTIPGSVCLPSLSTGTPCPKGDRQCASGRCRPGTSVMECAAPASVGQTCASDQDCSPTKNLFCVSLKCAAPPFDNGTVCTQADQCKSKLCHKGKCSAFGQAGVACATSDAPPCDESLYCSGPLGGPNTCAPRKQFGALCTEPRECFGGCSASFGVLRCSGAGESKALCGGS